MFPILCYYIQMAASKQKDKTASDTETKQRFTRTVPHDTSTEQSVLGCVLLDNNSGILVFGGLTEDDFYNQTHKIIFSAMKGLYDKSKPVDLVTLSNALTTMGKIDNAGGVDYLMRLADVVPSVQNLRHYIDLIKRDSILRKLITAGNQIVTDCFGADSAQAALASAEKLIFDVGREGERRDLTLLSAELPEAMERFDTISRDPTAMRGLKTGFYSLDDITNGLQKSNLIIIAARPGEGKTSLGLNIVTNAALKSKARCAVFSLEMSKQELTTRALCSVACVDLTKAQRGELSPAEIARIFAANKELAEVDIYIDDNAQITAPEILSKCMRLKRERGGLDLVLVDYLGLMIGSDRIRQNRQVEVADNSRMMKILAKELEMPVILVSQLNRSFEKRKIDKSSGEDAQPILSDLRESGAIEQDADIVMFIHNKNKGKGEGETDSNNSEKQEREIIIEKHRAGRTGKFTLLFDGACTRFFNSPSCQAAQDAKTAAEKGRSKSNSAKQQAVEKRATEQKINDESDRKKDHVTLADDGADVF